MPEDRDSRIWAYWEDPETQSMEDQYLASLEAEMLARHIREDDVVLDIGCGDGTGSQVYRKHCRRYVGLDRSVTRLANFASREPGCILIRGDLRFFPFKFSTGHFTAVISQRSLINLPDRATLEEVLRQASSLVLPGGRFLICEAFQEGLDKLNALRTRLGSKPIQPKWHNIYLDRDLTNRVLGVMGLELVEEEDLSVYYFLTRVVHQALVGKTVPVWDSPMNKIAYEIARSRESPSFKGLSTIILQVWRKRERV